MKRLLFTGLVVALAGCWSANAPEGEPSGAAAANLTVGESAAARQARRLAFARRVAANGIVLLANEGNALPLTPDQEIVLLGYTSYCPHGRGRCVGEQPSARPVAYDEGLTAAGFWLEPTFAAFYRAERDRRQAVEVAGGDVPWASRFAEPPLTGAAFDALAAGIDRTLPCLVTIGRAAGEGEDLREARGSYRLHAEERQLLEDACRTFDTVIVLLNTCGVIDTSFMDELPIKALVHTSLLGQTAGLAVADVLSGQVTPSGKTVDTWAKRYSDYATTDCFGALEVPYREGVFLGYRHFDRAGITPRYPFGYGLSYTTFGLSFGEATVEGTRVSVPVTVANTGARKGAEVVQAYLARPAHDPRLEPVKRLCAFAKTKILAPGQCQTLTLAFDAKDMAFYDEATASWGLPAGNYVVLIGASSDTAAAAATFDLPQTVVATTTGLFDAAHMIRVGAAELPLSPFEMTVTLDDVRMGMATVEQVAAQLSDDELAALVRCEPMTAARVLGGIATYGVPASVCLAGAAGLQIAPDHPAAGRLVSWPCATALAQGWDVRFADWFGRLVAEELAEVGADGWQVPGLNLHRNPLCGRNCETFAEDPLLAGKLGAAVIRGVQTAADEAPSGRYAVLATVGLAGQEAQRDEQIAVVGEKALRELYLKPFEIAVREGRPRALVLGGVRLNQFSAAEGMRLLIGLVREEWAYPGLVLDERADAGGLSRAARQQEAVRLLNLILDRPQADGRGE